MSNLTFVELETFFNEATEVLAELRNRKLLKKLPEDVASKVNILFDKYCNDPTGENEVPAQHYDTRTHREAPPTTITSCPENFDGVWWTGNIEVKGLFNKGQKLQKCYCIAHSGPRLSFFAGAKKKPLKGQMVMSRAAQVTVVPDGKKQGNIVSISELSYPAVTLKFSSVEEGKSWLNGYNASYKSSDVQSILSGEGDCVSLHEIAVEDEICEQTTEPSNPTPDTTRDDLTTDNSLSRDSQSRGSGFVEDWSEEEELTEESPPQNIWGDFDYSRVFQTEWSFSPSGYKGLIQLKRGQLVLLVDKVNEDWWKVVDCSGKVGLVAACFLSLAYELS